ncbi:MAG: BREX system P-loop protein BrxC, partial [Deltaproteobacteria bacterium]|nr:BREX system P-loop protein BrxC [Deltaproteobacteria bacterium]
QRRLLEKNELGVSVLADIYHREANNLKTLFDFIDGAQTYRNFRDRDHFIHAYPFIPYQFDLFQKAIQNLSIHNAFEGQHSSVGERSMLGVFQQVAIQILKNDIGHLATFDLMFTGLRTALKTQFQQSIRLAEDNLGSSFAVRLLKALFLVKYIKDFKATAKNLRILMLDGFNVDMKALTRQVEEALELLVQQTYIQRHGEEYEFLTNEEKDVESEIKATEIDLSEAADELARIAFEHILKIQKVRYEANDQNYSFSRKLDNQLYGREQELAIHLISFFNDEDEKTIKAQAGARSELLLIMPSDKRLMDDLILLKKTEKYIRQNVTITQKDSVRQILAEKTTRNRERRQNLQQQIKTLLSKAKLYIAGQEIEESAEDPQARVVNACQLLISRTYPNLAMLPGINYSEKDILTILRAKQPALSGLSEAEQEMLSFIQGNHRHGIRTTVKVLVDKLEGKPYGWYLMAVICNLAKLCSLGKVEVQEDSTLLDDVELEAALKNTRRYANLILKPQVEFTAAQIRALKEFFNDFFDRPPLHQEAKALALETGEELQALLQTLRGFKPKVADYPFLANLEELLALIAGLTGKPYACYLTELAPKADELLELKEDKIDPLINFMTGSRKKNYDEIQDFLRAQKTNFSYLESDAENRLQSIINDPFCYRNNAIHEAKILLEETRQQLQKLIAAEKEKAEKQLLAWENQLTGMKEFAAVPGELQQEIRKTFNRCRDNIRQQNLIAV